MTIQRVPPVRRFLARIQIGESCWEWQGGLNESGYGKLSLGGRGGKWVKAHRFAYELLRGPIPPGLELDHLCKNPRCVNPGHLEPVTHRENLLRGAGFAATKAAQTHCVNGHEFTPENTRVTTRGQRQCRSCHQGRRM